MVHTHKMVHTEMARINMVHTHMAHTHRVHACTYGAHVYIRYGPARIISAEAIVDEPQVVHQSHPLVHVHLGSHLEDGAHLVHACGIDIKEGPQRVLVMTKHQIHWLRVARPPPERIRVNACPVWHEGVDMVGADATYRVGYAIRDARRDIAHE